VGHRVAGWALDLLDKVSVDFEEPVAERRLPPDAVLVYVMNHRSNADYVLVSYALAGEVAISYAVGEWARAFPLESLFKAFGSYFIRRRYRDPLYHAVLERYVQLITREGVTQGIFVEGGLTRDGRLRAPKIGLLDYVLGIGRDPAFAARLHVVPVAINYDRVLEDRTLLRELESATGGQRASRLAQLREVGDYLVSNIGRMASRRFQRYGRAAVVVGAPIPLAPWFASHPDLFSLDKSERLGLGADRTSAESFDRAWRMLQMRRIVARMDDGYLVLPRGRPLVSYYANSITHLLGPFMEAVRSRDSLPVDALGV